MTWAMTDAASRPGGEDRSSLTPPAGGADRRAARRSWRGLLDAERGRRRLALAAGLEDLRLARLGGGSGAGWGVALWGAEALGIAVLLLGATLVVATVATPARTPPLLPTFADPRAGEVDVLRIAGANALVLALHCLICVASYLALRSVPAQARRAGGADRVVREVVRPLALAVLAAFTLLSLSLQAWRAGHALAAASATLGLSHLGLLARLSVHAVPELTGVFLPLAACLELLCARRHRDLLAAALVALALALPLIVVAACCEVWVTRLLL